MATNYETVVPASLRSEVEQRFARAVEERKVHPQAEAFVQSLAMAAYCWPDPAHVPDRVQVLIAGLPAEDGPGGCTSWAAARVDGMPAYDPMLYRIHGDPNAVAVGRFKASLRKFLGIGIGG